MGWIEDQIAQMKQEVHERLLVIDILEATLKPKAKPKKPRRRRPKAKVTVPAVPPDSPTPLVLHLGSGGHTAHPTDPDAEAIRDSLAYTSEEPAG